MMNTDFPYLKFLDIARECRNTMILDTLNHNSPDLYDALYSNVNTEIHKIKLELYELSWIEIHWERIIDFINKKECSISEKKELISMFSKWYKNFVSSWNYTDFDTTIIEQRISILRTLVSVNNEWEQNMKRVKVSFEKSRKILNEKIKELEMGE